MSGRETNKPDKPDEGKGDGIMKAFNELNAHNSTIIEWEGKELRTTQNPHPTDDGKMYTANAVDADNNEYVLVWSIIDPDITDESSICDWDNPEGVMLVK
ncbi:hypothetical protein [Paenibacillus solani]|uniref:hypothetical protein n=1 Tax=Paenibacillus solani TaxID=1705565 RepID=UPI003D27415D